VIQVLVRRVERVVNPETAGAFCQRTVDVNIAVKVSRRATGSVSVNGGGGAAGILGVDGVSVVSL